MTPLEQVVDLCWWSDLKGFILNYQGIHKEACALKMMGLAVICCCCACFMLATCNFEKHTFILTGRFGGATSAPGMVFGFCSFEGCKPPHQSLQLRTRHTLGATSGCTAWGGKVNVITEEEKRLRVQTMVLWNFLLK